MHACELDGACCEILEVCWPNLSLQKWKGLCCSRKQQQKTQTKQNHPPPSKTKTKNTTATAHTGSEAQNKNQQQNTQDTSSQINIECCVQPAFTSLIPTEPKFHNNRSKKPLTLYVKYFVSRTRSCVLLLWAKLDFSKTSFEVGATLAKGAAILLLHSI